MEDRTSGGAGSGASVDEDFEMSFNKILSSLQEEPVEDGVSHKGEEFVAEILKEHGEKMLADRTLNTDNSCTKAYVMQLIGRVEVPSAEVRRRIVREGLASNDILIRDAAVQMVENWEDPGCLDLLKRHKDPVNWLDDYAREVIEAIEN